MSATQTAWLIIGILVLGGLAAAAWFIFRRRSLRERFGPEYDRVVADQDSRREAERELRDRERRHTTLDIRPLDSQAQERYAASWRELQARFVEDPAGAVVAGDELLTRLMAERGYPTDDYEDQLSLLSVEHARTLAHYRDAHDVYVRGQKGEVSTEQLRQALVHYRVLFADLLNGSPSDVGSPEIPPSEAGRERGSPDRELADPDSGRAEAVDAEARATREADADADADVSGGADDARRR
jgi:hypothetical protein